MKKKNYIITIILLAICLFNCATIKAISLTNSKLNVSDINGTNGCVFTDSESPVTFGQRVGHLCCNTNSFLSFSNAIIREKPKQLLTNIRTLNGTNGFVFNDCTIFSTARTPQIWPTGYWIAGLTTTYSTNGHLPYFLLNYNGLPLLPEVSITNEFWNNFSIVHVTNNTILSPPVVIAGNFLTNSYSLMIGSGNPASSLRCYENPAFTNILEYLHYNASNTPTFTGFKGYLLEKQIVNVGDVNSDDYDDLLVRNHLLFGGKDWSNPVILTNISTNRVLIKADYWDPEYGDVGFAGGTVGALGDINGDEINDFAYTVTAQSAYFGYSIFETIVVYGKTNWGTILSIPYHTMTGFNGFEIENIYAEITGGGDVNGDGHNDLILVSPENLEEIKDGTIYVIYGGPFIKPIINPDSEINGINGFCINTISSGEWFNADIESDINSDGYNDILFSVGASSRPTNYAWLVYGGQSPSAPPALRTPLWINVGESNSLIYELDSIPTNFIWTGCKKGDDYTLCYTNGARCSAWDIPMDKLWFTNSYTISNASEIFSVSYTSTNALGPAIGYTTLTLEPVPEPLSTGIVVLTTALIGKAIFK